MRGRQPCNLVDAEILVGCKDAAEELGIDVKPMMRDCGIDPELMLAPAGFIHHYQASKFLYEVARQHNCPHFGFLVGMHQPALRLGPGAALLSLAPRLRDALENLERYLPVYSEGSKHLLVIESDRCLWQRWDANAYDVSTVQMRMLGILQAFKAIATLSGPGWQAEAVYFRHAAPPQAAQFSHYLRCPVLFDQGMDAIAFPKTDLDREIATADPRLLHIVRSHFDSVLANRHSGDDIVTKTEYFIRLNLGRQVCNLGSCAQYLNLHPRSLQRELENQHTTFKTMLTTVRMELAQQYLRDSGISLSDLADMLGYHSLSAFSRAFQRAHGLSPSAWRARHS